MTQYNAHLVFMEWSLFSHIWSLSLSKDLKAFEICVSSSASSLWLLVTVEPRYLSDLFILSDVLPVWVFFFVGVHVSQGKQGGLFLEYTRVC